MAFSSPHSHLSASPNVTPLIDVLLVLLIIFMVITPVSSHGLESLIPRASAPIQSAPSAVPLMLDVVAVGASGTTGAYRLNGQRMTPPQLALALRELQAQAPERDIFISGDRGLDYRPVVVAVSKAYQAGFRHIGLLPLR